ncbi:MAG: hypothetical protein IIB06_10255, partial [Bacteroidetes bacterium]|nr:hypothetical protein [Bacteroidota bacterium]
ADDGLAQTEFAPSVDVALENRREVYFLPRERLAEGVTPQCGLSVDFGFIETITGIPPGSADLAISVRDYSSRDYKVLARWPLREIPPTWKYDRSDPPMLGSHDGLNFALTVSLTQDLEKQVEGPYRELLILMLS